MVFTRSFAAHKLLYLCMDKVSQPGPTSTKSGSCELESRYTRLLGGYSGLQTLCPWPEGILVIHTLTQKAGTTTRCTLNFNSLIPTQKKFWVDGFGDSYHNTRSLDEDKYFGPAPFRKGGWAEIT